MQNNLIYIRTRNVLIYITNLSRLVLKANYKKEADGDGRFIILFGWEPNRIVWKRMGVDVIWSLATRE